MKNPNPVNLKTVDEVRAEGWVGQSRDEDGHLISCTLISQDDDQMGNWIMECLSHGETVTFYPPTK